MAIGWLDAGLASNSTAALKRARLLQEAALPGVCTAVGAACASRPSLAGGLPRSCKMAAEAGGSAGTTAEPPVDALAAAAAALGGRCRCCALPMGAWLVSSRPLAMRRPSVPVSFQGSAKGR